MSCPVTDGKTRREKNYPNFSLLIGSMMTDPSSSIIISVSFPLLRPSLLSCPCLPFILFSIHWPSSSFSYFWFLTDGLFLHLSPSHNTISQVMMVHDVQFFILGLRFYLFPCCIDWSCLMTLIGVSHRHSRTTSIQAYHSTNWCHPSHIHRIRGISYRLK